jgi:hypothetical protein
MAETLLEDTKHVHDSLIRDRVVAKLPAANLILVRNRKGSLHLGFIRVARFVS